MSKVFISEDDQYLFAQGTHYDIYKKLGSHVSEENGEKGIYFAVWAPNAREVYVVGSFNHWNAYSHRMERLGPGGIHALFVPGIGVNEQYKYLIISPEGHWLYKADPYANYAEIRPGTASKTTDLTNFEWTDEAWLEERDKKDNTDRPVAIYECHIGSWMRHPSCPYGGFYNYREFRSR